MTAAISGRNTNIIFGMFSNSARPKVGVSLMILRQASRRRGSYSLAKRADVYLERVGAARIFQDLLYRGEVLRRRRRELRLHLLACPGLLLLVGQALHQRVDQRLLVRGEFAWRLSRRLARGRAGLRCRLRVLGRVLPAVARAQLETRPALLVDVERRGRCPDYRPVSRAGRTRRSGSGTCETAACSWLAVHADSPGSARPAGRRAAAASARAASRSS